MQHLRRWLPVPVPVSQKTEVLLRVTLVVVVASITCQYFLQAICVICYLPSHKQKRLPALQHLRFNGLELFKDLVSATKPHRVFVGKPQPELTTQCLTRID